MNTNIKSAVGLFSGGLDSWLAALLIKKQGFKVYLLHFSSPYFGYVGEGIQKLRDKVIEYGMELIVVEPSDEYLNKVFCNPEYGYGSSKNACIDCHGYMLKVAKNKMEELKAEFVFSGEVLGQRPMSQQRRGLHAVENQSGLKGFLVRPLSAKLLDPSIPEQNGILNREMLMAISGRGRKEQVALAEELGLKEFPQPAGGCKFTDPNLTKRLSKMLEINRTVTWDDLKLIRFSRNFYVGNGVYFYVTREEKELALLSKFFDMGIIVEPLPDMPGATGLAVKYDKSGFIKNPEIDKETLDILGRIISRYTKAYQQGCLDIEICFAKNSVVFLKEAYVPFTEQDLEKYRL